MATLIYENRFPAFSTYQGTAIVEGASIQVIKLPWINNWMVNKIIEGVNKEIAEQGFTPLAHLIYRETGKLTYTYTTYLISENYSPQGYGTKAIPAAAWALFKIIAWIALILGAAYFIHKALQEVTYIKWGPPYVDTETRLASFEVTKTMWTVIGIVGGLVGLGFLVKLLKKDKAPQPISYQPRQAVSSTNTTGA